MRAEAAVDGHFIKMPDRLLQVSYVPCWELGCAPQHSFSLTSAAVPEVETQNLQCSGLAQFIHLIAAGQQYTGGMLVLASVQVLIDMISTHRH